MQKPNRPLQVHRYPFADYPLRDGAEVWLVSAGDSQVELTDTPGIKVDLARLNQLTDYVDTGPRDTGYRSAVRTRVAL